MGLKFEPLGKYIHEVDVRNTGLSITKLMGVNLSKQMMPSVANIIGTDLSTYKIVRNRQFACKLMSVGRDACLPIALKLDEEPVIISSAYYSFEVNNENELLPEYLMLCFLRPDFDRELWFQTGGDVRGGVTWEAFCNIKIPIQSIEEQRKFVRDYQIITDRIKLLRKINETLEDFVYASYKSIIENNSDACITSTLGKTSLITTGKLNSEDAVQDGAYPFFTCSQETYRTNSFAFNQEAVLLAGNNANAIYPLKLYKGKFNAYQRTYVISSTHSCVSNKQLFFVLKEKLKDFKEQSYGTATKFLTMSILAPIPVLVPSEQIALQFSKIANKSFDLIAINNREIDLLEMAKHIHMSNMTKGA